MKKEKDLLLSADHLRVTLELKDFLFPVFWPKEEITVGDLA